ncbi:MarR family transcriptional regulator [Enterococcus sp.]|jgi:DNA-binding MarR family transcriptional regulator|uniref:MarR family winged helix-turn-helix transcriptional regulator n=1 Tax=Enterococcus sp. TaxID=35783 RepID=UPI0025B812AE|nr:MarR family transcriptional regulator [Enterococcus sp.]
MAKAVEKFDISVFAEVFSLLGNLLFEEVGLEDLKLTKMEMLELVLVSTNEGITMSELARQIGTSKVQISRSIAGLEKAGFVMRKTNETNRRRVNVFMCEAGKELFSRKKQQIEDRLNTKVSVMSSTDFKELYQALDQVIHLLRKYDILKEHNCPNKPAIK